VVKLISELKGSPLSEFAFNNREIFVLVDDNTLHHCFPKIASHINVKAIITIKAGEENKTLSACEKIWQVLTENNADRNALLINLGGGMVCDVGGFAAACYKRGIQFIHMPTTLLAMVDAAIGGKTGIDFMGFKNQVGVFCMPQQVIIHSEFLQTLPERELKAGFAEVIKHYLIYNKEAFYELTQLSALPNEWEKQVDKNVKIKQHFTDADPTEQGIRKALNFGHTIGHALESYYLKDEYTNLLHGEAVAAGMICESFISYKREMLTEAELADIVHYLLRIYNLPHLPEPEFNNIVQLVRQDKKNAAQVTRCVLLQGIGHVSIDNAVDDNLIKEALEYYNSVGA
jgi:3-dehydroquinate synthase